MLLSSKRLNNLTYNLSTLLKLDDRSRVHIVHRVTVEALSDSSLEGYGELTLALLLCANNPLNRGILILVDYLASSLALYSILREGSEW